MKRFHFLLYMIISSAFGVSCKADDADPSRFVKQREAMIRTQIESRGIRDLATLNALRKVERHKFVPQKYQNHAYEDHPLPIGEDQTISQPYIVALMTQVLDLKKNEKVLEVGTGSGYQAAVLAEICDHVYTIEIIDILGRRAQKVLADLGYKNVNVKIGDGYKGWEKHSPFDAIIVTCAPTHIPEPLKNQLAEGGKMVIPVGKTFAQELVLLTKENGEIIRKAIIPVRFVPMLGENGKKY